MNRQQEHPAVADSAAGGGGQPEAIAEAAAVVPFAPRKRAVSAVMNAAGELWLHPDRLLHWLWHGNPKTLAEHRTYIKSRGWVPPEMTGKPAVFVTAAGIAYHVLIARWVKAACKAVDGSADYPLRFFGLLVFIAVIFLIVL